MADSLDKRTTVWTSKADDERIRAAAKKTSRPAAQIIRAAIRLGLDAIDKDGDKAISRALSSGDES